MKALFFSLHILSSEWFLYRLSQYYQRVLTLSPCIKIHIVDKYITINFLKVHKQYHISFIRLLLLLLLGVCVCAFSTEKGPLWNSISPSFLRTHSVAIRWYRWTPCGHVDAHTHTSTQTVVPTLSRFLYNNLVIEVVAFHQMKPNTWARALDTELPLCSIASVYIILVLMLLPSIPLHCLLEYSLVRLFYISFKLSSVQSAFTKNSIQFFL